MNDIVIPDPGCKVCREPLPFAFTYAFQPIVDLGNHTVFAYEALIRGLNGESALSVLEKVTDQNRYRFDQECRIRSIRLAKKLGMTSKISINFMPNAIYSPEMCIRTTLQAAYEADFPVSQIIFEVLESEEIFDPEKLREIFLFYQKTGFMTAIDDFGSGFAGLTLLAKFAPDIIKIDMQLVRNIDQDTVKQAIVLGILLTSQNLGIRIIAEGIETAAEAQWFKAQGVTLMQGYFFAKPGFEQLPVPRYLENGNF